MPETVSLIPTPPTTRAAFNHRAAAENHSSSGHGEDGTDSALAFAATLLRSQMGSSIGVRKLELPLASQMFEPQGIDPRAHRRETLKQDYRAEGLHRERSLETATAGHAVRRDQGSASAIQRGAPSGESLFPSPTGLQRREGLSGEDLNSSRQARASAIAGTTAKSTHTVRSTNERLEARGPATFANTTRPLTPASSAGVTAIAAPATTANSAAKLGSVAHETARALATNRVGDVETARAPAPAGDAAKTASQRNAGGRETAASRDRGGASRSANDATENRTVEKSPFDRVVRSMRMRTTAHRSSAVLHLDPPDLGRVRVDVKLVGNHLAIDIKTETEAARRLLGERVAQLRAALSEHGIRIERIDVSRAADIEHGTNTSMNPDSRETNGSLDGQRGRPTRFGMHTADGRTIEALAEENDGIELSTAGERRIDVRV